MTGALAAHEQPALANDIVGGGTFAKLEMRVCGFATVFRGGVWDAGAIADASRSTPWVGNPSRARPYRLLEHLACTLYEELRPALPAQMQLWLEVAKERPPLAEPDQNARFALGDRLD